MLLLAVFVVVHGELGLVVFGGDCFRYWSRDEQQKRRRRRMTS